MTYKLAFKPPAQKEWDKLDSTIRNQFKNKLAEVLKNPKVKKNFLYQKDKVPYYKIKLRDSGYRLVYGVKDQIVTVTITSVGKRNKDDVYKKAKRRT